MPLVLPPNDRVDDVTIADSCPLWRGVAAPWMHRPWGTTFSSAAFRTEELSVILGDGMALDQAKSELAGFSIAQVPASIARRAGLIIARDPAKRWHGLIYRRDTR